MIAGHWTRSQYDSIIQLVRERTGLTFPATIQRTVEARLRSAWSRCGRPSPRDYLAAIGSDGRAFDALVAELTVGETYFFREPAQFDFIRSEVLPALVRQWEPGRKLRVWSAGCASGEEAYSLAILFREAGLNDNLTILGTDISRERLERAKEARYSRWSLRGVSPQVTERYFARQGNSYRLAPEIRQAVSYRPLNLGDDLYPSLQSGVWGMDVVLCRNVLIYLAPDMVAEVGRRLIESLDPNGWLFLGASDPMLGDLVPCEVVHSPGGIAYRRPAAGSTLPVRPPAPVAFTPRVRSPEMVSISVAQSHGEATVAEAMAGGAVANVEVAMLATLPEVPAGTSSGYSPRRGVADEWIVRARSLADRGRLHDAHRACLTGLAQHPESAPLMYLQALLCSAAGRHGEAAAAARRALYVDGNLIMAHVALAQARLRLKDAGAATRALLNAERLLSRMHADEPVPASDGQPADQLRKFVQMQLTLLGRSE